ncbi:UNVERIFIED_CONTAM: hypothetical protein GTU68_058708 [Idotea baltica]|nr:hypothetical protein [Idotea baltica]
MRAATTRNKLSPYPMNWLANCKMPILSSSAHRSTTLAYLPLSKPMLIWWRVLALHSNTPKTGQRACLPVNVPSFWLHLVACHWAHQWITQHHF